LPSQIRRGGFLLGAAALITERGSDNDLFYKSKHFFLIIRKFSRQNTVYYLLRSKDFSKAVLSATFLIL